MEEVALVVVAEHEEMVTRLVGGHALGQCRRRRGVGTRQVYSLPVQVCRKTQEEYVSIQRLLPCMKTTSISPYPQLSLPTLSYASAVTTLRRNNAIATMGTTMTASPVDSQPAAFTRAYYLC